MAEEVEVLTPISVEAEVQKYTLVGDDIYVKRYVNDNIPTWYKDLIDNVINTNTTITSQQDAIDYLNTLGLGFSQSITSLQNKDTQIDSAIESLVTSNGENTSAIGQLDATKITANDATAIATNTIGSYFGNEANSWFDSKISTYSSAITSNANSISTLSSSLNGANVRIDSVESVNIAQNTSISNAQSTANTAYTWSANASKLITNPDGGITGWSFGDGTNTKSYFKVYANNFSVSDGSTGYTPFSISGGNINFNGIVSFSNVTNLQSTVNTINTNVSTAQSTANTAVTNAATAQSTANSANTLAATKATIADVQALGYVLPAEVANAINNNTTTINGSKITTGSIMAAQINAAAITSDKLEASAITGKVITGGAIYGTVIDGAVITASYIETTSNYSLTDYKYFTSSNPPPSQYLNNFAKDNNGNVIVDGSGYYRLPKVKIASFTGANPVTYYSDNGGVTRYTDYQFADISYSIGSYDSYMSSSANRVRSINPSFDITSNNGIVAYGAVATHDRNKLDFTLDFGNNLLRVYHLSNGGIDGWHIYINGTSVADLNASGSNSTVNIGGTNVLITSATEYVNTSGGYKQGYTVKVQITGGIVNMTNITNSVDFGFKNIVFGTYHDADWVNCVFYPPTLTERI